jgi:hypothetical protein
MITDMNTLRSILGTTKTDDELTSMVKAAEQLVRRYTHNNFQDRDFRLKADITGISFQTRIFPLFKVGDEIQISDSAYNNGLYTVSSVTEDGFKVSEDVIPESNVLCTKVVYPADVQMGVINMLKWDLTNRDKVGIQSESISRHSVTYFNMDGDNSLMGYPKSLMGFLKPYIKARF